MLGLAGHIENVATSKRTPAILPQSLQLTVKDVEGLSISVAMNRHDTAGRKAGPDQAVSVIGVRQRRKVLDPGTERVQNLPTASFFRHRYKIKDRHDSDSHLKSTLRPTAVRLGVSLPSKQGARRLLVCQRMKQIFALGKCLFPEFAKAFDKLFQDALHR
jgi:hypothetical protein